MITILDAQKRYYYDYGWSRVHRLFPSKSIYEQGHTHFGNTVIINDYTVFPNFGYDMHPHQNLEQIFFVMGGELTHHDSLKNTAVLKNNFIQRITAGSGYARSLHNTGEFPSRHIGVWLLPKTQNTLPAHDAREYDPQLWYNRLYPVASDVPERENADGQPPISFNAPATLFRATVDNATLTSPVSKDQKALLYIIGGDVECNGNKMKTGDHARITGEELITLHSGGKAECIFILMRTDF